MIPAMAETIPIQIRWPKTLASQVRAIAANRHTTLSELTRQAVIERFHLHGDDLNPVNHETSSSKGGSLS
jgi:hypothetical protein